MYGPCLWISGEEGADTLRKLWTWHTDVVKENKTLKERLDVRAEFERRKAELVSRQEDDNLYRDANGRYHCPICLNADSKFVPVLNHFEGSYYCVIHQQVFETEERRLRSRNVRPQRVNQKLGPYDWMAR